jgi:hypothetical protein
MNENPNRVACSKCGAANFPSSANCWQCGEPLRVEGTAPEPPPPGPEPEPGATPPTPPPSPVYVPPTARQDTETLVIVGFVCAGLGLMGCCCGCCSWVLSITAIVLGAIAYSKGDNRGMWVIIAGAVALVAGVVPTVVSLPFQHRFNPPWPGPFPGPWRNI